LSQLSEKAKKAIEDEGLPIIVDEKTKLPLYVDVNELPLRYQFGIAKVHKFFEGLREGKIYMTRCKKCSEKFFPPRADCPKCLSQDMEWILLSGRGELLTCTVVNVKPPSFTHYKDYVVAIAEMEEGVRVLAWLDVDDPKKIRPRMKVHLRTVKRPGGLITYEFAPT
jgi:uncharacterized OB-fold protein